MDLIYDPWIPVLIPDGEVQLLSLAEVFRQSSEIADLTVSPPQRIAMTRLLICIVQAALDGPEDTDDWTGCKERIVPQSLAYLERWKDRFELRGETPFMQITDLTVEQGKEKAADMLDCRLSSGNNAALFDQAATPEGRSFDDGELALNLITFLNFSTGGKVGQGQWHGKKYSDSTFAAPCIKYAHTFILGDNLLDTLFFNLLCKEDEEFGVNSFLNCKWGRPVWEKFPQDVTDAKAFENAGRTYLGRLVPLSRFVKLVDQRRCIIGPTHKTFKIEQLPVFREPSATVKINSKTNDHFYLPLSSDKHMWRELPAILSFKTSDREEGGIPALGKLLNEAFELPNDHVEIWVGGLETGAQAAKLSDMLEWRFRVPLALLGSTGLHQYENGILLAERAEWILAEAVKTCFKDLKMETKQAPLPAAKTLFWSHLDCRYNLLLDATQDQFAALSDRWYPEVRRAMQLAYDHVCPRETPRQIQAFAKGLQQLRLKKPD